MLCDVHIGIRLCANISDTGCYVHCFFRYIGNPHGTVANGIFHGREAIDVLSYVEYDAVILDVMMPKADGYEVLRFLRDAGKTTPVLFLTAKDAVSDRVKGLDSGANDYLIKPFSFEELSARLRVMMRTSFGIAGKIRITHHLLFLQFKFFHLLA